MNKIKNATRRFRQGRMTFQKLTELLVRYNQEESVGADSAALETKPHVHGEHCHHE